MVSATDIITYIGVPLAVLGVLPIFYTFFVAILRTRRMRTTLLRHGHRPLTSLFRHEGFSIRSSPMTSLIEVELPRYLIAPYERSSELYWKLDEDAGHAHGDGDGDDQSVPISRRIESTMSMVEKGHVDRFLKGGSWRTFHWMRLVVGRKLYRIQYEDELREPPADIDFTDLVPFLLDWGAVPDEMGWAKLKSGGLWTPGGTVLLKRKEEDGENSETKIRRGADWVLKTMVPDDSDGVLCLNVNWGSRDDVPERGRGAGSLPPGWGRLEQAEKGTLSGQVESKGLAGRIEEFISITKAASGSETLRFRVDGNAIKEVSWEHGKIETGLKTSLWQDGKTSPIVWFTSAVSGLLYRKHGHSGLWGYQMPSHISTFAKNESMPCGILVILGLIAEIDTPPWQTEDPNGQSGSHVQAMQVHERFLKQHRAIALEKTMSDAQARIARMNRLAEDNEAIRQNMREQQLARTEKEERRIKDAIASPGIGNKAVAEACLAWLIEKGEAGREWTVDNLAEAVLYLMVVDQRHEGEAVGIAHVLEEWMGWAQNGGIRKSHIAFLEERKVEFCFAAALVYMIQEAAGASAETGADMMECLRIWKRVRLG